MSCREPLATLQPPCPSGGPSLQPPCPNRALFSSFRAQMDILHPNLRAWMEVLPSSLPARTEILCSSLPARSSFTHWCSMKAVNGTKINHATPLPFPQSQYRSLPFVRARRLITPCKQPCSGWVCSALTWLRCLCSC